MKIGVQLHPQGTTMADLRTQSKHGGGLEEIFLKFTGENAARNLVEVLDA